MITRFLISSPCYSQDIEQLSRGDVMRKPIEIGVAREHTFSNSIMMLVAHIDLHIIGSTTGAVTS